MSTRELAANLAFWIGAPASAHQLATHSGWSWLQAGGAGLAVGIALALVTSWVFGFLESRGR